MGPEHSRHSPGLGELRHHGSEFRTVCRLIRAHCAEAAGRLAAKYRPEIVRITRGFLRRRNSLQRVVDASDIEQDAFRRVFEAIMGRKAPEEEDAFHRFLLQVTINSCRTQSRRYAALKRALSRDQELFDSVKGKIAVAATNPADMAALKDEWERFVAEAPPRERVILQLRAGQRTVTEIADILHVSARTIERSLKHELARWLASGGGVDNCHRRSAIYRSDAPARTAC